MFKALLHKQMLEVRRMYLQGGRSKKAARKTSPVGMMILFVFLYIVLAGSFFAMSIPIGEPLFTAGKDWIFFLIMGLLAFLMGVIGGVLSASSALFRAKDNEFLLAMPIPPSKILLVRMLSIYIMGFIYESMVMIPAIAAYCIFSSPSPLAVIFCVLALFVLGFFILTFSCFFGWIAALIASKLKNKTALTVIVSVIAVCAFLALRFMSTQLVTALAENAAQIGEAIKGWAYPFYMLAEGMTGNVLYFLIFVLLTAALMFITCLLMSKSFQKIATTKSQTKKAVFSETQIQTRSIKAALRWKEWKRFTSTPVYIVNCGLGLLFLVAGAVLLLIKLVDLRFLMETLGTQLPFLVTCMPVFGVFAVCALTLLCDIAAPSISLEGSNIRVLQSLPLHPYQIFRAKLFVHIVLTETAALLCTVAMIIVLQPSVTCAIAMLLYVTVFVYFGAACMLYLDIKRPHLTWTDETQPIKQNLNILIIFFVGLLLPLGFGALYYPVSAFIRADLYLLLCAVLFALLTLLLHKWFKGKGSAIFASL